jgi:hypothetical protein
MGKLKVSWRRRGRSPIHADGLWVPPGREIIGKRESPLTAVLVTSRALVPEEAAMEEHFVWMTTRRIKPGTLTDFESAWRPDRHPEGMQRAYAYWSEDEQQIIGVSF